MSETEIVIFLLYLKTKAVNTQKMLSLTLNSSAHHIKTRNPVYKTQCHNHTHVHLGGIILFLKKKQGP